MVGSNRSYETNESDYVVGGALVAGNERAWSWYGQC